MGASSKKVRTASAKQSSRTSLRSFAFSVVTLDTEGIEVARRRARAQQFTERLGKRASLQMVQIPGGIFLMGAPEGEPGSTSSERPQHRVTVGGFFLAKHAVTIEQWRAVMGSRPEAMSLADAVFKKSGRQPVVRVSFDEAETFCARLAQDSTQLSPTERVRVGVRVPRRYEHCICIRPYNLTRGGEL